MHKISATILPGGVKGDFRISILVNKVDEEFDFPWQRKFSWQAKQRGWC